MRLFAELVAGVALLAASQSALAQSGEDREAAQAAYAAGDHARAQRILELLVAENPNDADLLRRLASTQAAGGDLAGAMRTIDRALALSPDDPDVQLARANILAWSGRTVEARRQADTVAIARPDYPGLAETRAAIARGQADGGFRLFALGFGGSVSDVQFAGTPSQTWWVANAALGATVAPRTRAAIEIEREERSLVDTRLLGRVDFLRSASSFFVSGSATPSPDFRESWSIGAGGETAIGPATTLFGDARYAAYRTDDVGVAGLGLRQRIGADWSFTARTINLFGGGDDCRLGGAVRLDYAPERRASWFVAAASYPDVEIGGTEQLHSISAGSGIPLGRATTLRIAGEYEKRDDSYERSAIALGLGWRFGGE